MLTMPIPRWTIAVQFSLQRIVIMVTTMMTKVAVLISLGWAHVLMEKTRAEVTGSWSLRD
jgi:hypothetical protein